MITPSVLNGIVEDAVSERLGECRTVPGCRADQRQAQRCINSRFASNLQLLINHRVDVVCCAAGLLAKHVAHSQSAGVDVAGDPF